MLQTDYFATDRIRTICVSQSPGPKSATVRFVLCWYTHSAMIVPLTAPIFHLDGVKQQGFNFLRKQCIWTMQDMCLMQGRHFISTRERVRGQSPRRGSRGQSPLVEVQGRSPSVFGILKVFLACIFVGNIIKFPNKLFVLCFKLHASVKANLHSNFHVNIYPVKHTVSNHQE